eukprot:1688806-Pleurochrysis_carterae.AAC.1
MQQEEGPTHKVKGPTEVLSIALENRQAAPRVVHFSYKMLRYAPLNEHMAVERRYARIRRERAGAHRGESDETKPITEIDRNCCERPESLRCAAPRPRDGQQWAMG